MNTCQGHWTCPRWNTTYECCYCPHRYNGDTQPDEASYGYRTYTTSSRYDVCETDTDRKE